MSDLNVTERNRQRVHVYACRLGWKAHSTWLGSLDCALTFFETFDRHFVLVCALHCLWLVYHQLPRGRIVAQTGPFGRLSLSLCLSLWSSESNSESECLVYPQARRTCVRYKNDLQLSAMRSLTAFTSIRLFRATVCKMCRQHGATNDWYNVVGMHVDRGVFGNGVDKQHALTVHNMPWARAHLLSLFSNVCSENPCVLVG